MKVSLIIMLHKLGSVKNHMADIGRVASVNKSDFECPIEFISQVFCEREVASNKQSAKGARQINMYCLPEEADAEELFQQWHILTKY
jgi:hypothetical protein